METLGFVHGHNRSLLDACQLQLQDVANYAFKLKQSVSQAGVQRGICGVFSRLEANWLHF